MRQEIVGYALGALDDAETREVEMTISRDTRLQEELRLLRQGLEPLGMDERYHDPPLGLADRTCAYVERQRLAVGSGDRWQPPWAAGPMVGLAERDLGSSTRGWTLLDLAVAAGVLVALGMLVLPAIQHSRFTSQIAACHNKLRELGSALHAYSKNHDGRIPEIPQSGPLAVAGVYAPKLLEEGLVSDPQTFICNSSAGACRERAAEIPTWGRLVEIAESDGDELDRVLAGMGGSYAYNLGYVTDGKYHTPSLGRRTRPFYAVMADAPCPRRGFAQSSNHAGNGQNVLFEDLHVAYLQTCTVPGASEDFYHNDEGQLAAGTSIDDAVVGPSQVRPLAGR